MFYYPSYITIEDLNVSGMMKNKHLSKAVASQKLYEFKTKFQAKCKEYGIEQRTVDDGNHLSTIRSSIPFSLHLARSFDLNS